MSKGRVWKRGETWWIQYSVNGRQYRETAKTPYRARADALLRERLTAVWEGRYFPSVKKAGQQTLGELRDDWIRERAKKRSLAADKQRLGAFVAYFGETRLTASITVENIRTWRAEIASGLRPATVNRYLAVVRSALNLARKAGHRHQDPMTAIMFDTEDNARDRLATPEEYARLVEAAESDLGACIIVGYWTGMRLGEIINLRWDKLDLVGGMLRLSAAATKEATAKTVPLPGAAVAALEALPRRGEKVFRHNRHVYSRQFRKLCAAVDPPVAGLHFHDLRHTALTRMADAGIDIMTMAAISGHKTLAMLRRYVHRRPAALKAAMAKIEAYATKG